MYFIRQLQIHGNGSEQSQCLAISEDGINFEKYDGNPLFDAPEGIQPDSFRDPKVWKHENKYYMVVGASRNNRGLALIYESADLYHWNFLNVLAESVENGDSCGNVRIFISLAINMFSLFLQWAQEIIHQYT